MLAAASAEAGKVSLSIDSRIGGDNNVFRSSVDRQQDGFFEFSPELGVSERNSKLNYSFSYRPTYETFFTTSNIDGFDHRALGSMTWRPSVIDTLGFTSSYTNNRRVRFEDDSGPSDPVVNLEGNARERVRRASVQLFYSHAFNSVLSVQAGANFGDTDYSRNTSIDSRGYSGSLGTQYVLTPLTVVGLSAAARFRETDQGAGFQASQETEIWNVSLSVRREVTPTLTFSAAGGPSFIRSTEDIPIPGVPDRKNRSTSFFADISVDKKWRRSSFNISYTRSESAGGGTQSTSILDTVSARFVHRPTSKWTLSLNGSWLQNEEIEPVTRAGREDTTQYALFAHVTRTISSHLSIIGHYSFHIQDENDSGGSGSIGAIHSGFLSLRYAFDPVVF